MKGLVVLLALAATCAGCVMDLPTGVRVERPRVFGVRLSVDEDLARAQPRPGEEVTLHWLTVPGGGQWTALISACVAAPSNTGLPACAGAPFAIVRSEPTEAPATTFTVPADAAGELAIAGVLCERGTPTFDAATLTPSCDGDGATAELVTYTVALASADEPNRHPSLADESFTLDGAPWLGPREPPASGCAASAGTAELPTVALRPEEEPSAIEFTSSEDDRESYLEYVIGDPPELREAREELLVSHAATAGTFARLQTEVFEGAAAPLRVEWRHPTVEEVPADGLTVRFWFVARDGRGGAHWVERAACVIPN